MTTSIAVAGKGGTGKTTFCGLLLRHLIKAGARPILAVDADANTNLNEVLAVPIEKTVASLRDELLRNMGMLPPSMPKETWVEYQLQTALVETEDYDLLAMGKAELSGCYCYVNSLLKRYIEVLSGNYRFVIMDNEAGMEHISRGLTTDIDLLFVLSDPSPRGILTAARIADLVEELRRKIRRVVMVVSRARGELHERLRRKIDELDVEFVGVLPYDELVEEYDLEGKSVLALPDTSPMVRAVDEILRTVELSPEGLKV